MLMIEIKSPIPLIIVDNPDGIPTGKGRAYFMDDGSIDEDIVWVIAMDATGECWSVRNRYIRFVPNRTYGRKNQFM